MPEPSIQVVFGGPGVGSPSWHLRGVLADIVVGEAIGFPNRFVSDEPKDVDVFVLDPPNELSTQDDRSSGTITFHELECGANGKVRFSIDTVIGSEFWDGDSITLTGTFSAPVGEPPP